MLPFKAILGSIGGRTSITTRRPETIRGHARDNRLYACLKRLLSRRAERGRSFSIVARQWCTDSVDTMPSLLRFLLVLCLLAGVAYGAMYALATWYNPKPREITVSIPPDRFTKQH
jgi:hypothetical protein